MKTHIAHYSPSKLRDELIKLIAQKCNRQILTHSFEPNYLYEYMRRQTCSLQMQWQTYYQLLPADEIQILCEVMSADMERVNSFAAVVAWLTIDGFRWHHYVKQKKEWQQTTPENEVKVPEDLSYGLILQYPEGVLRSAAYLLNYTSEQEVRDFLGERAYVDCCQRVRQAIRQYLPPVRLKALEAQELYEQ